jgi:predicted anti-sigma-YlaC factor YlaD
MDCERIREAISARIDGEELGVDAAMLERHLRSCFGCRQWESDATALGRTVRVRPAETVPDLSSRILAAIAQEPSARGRRRRTPAVVRQGLVLIGVLQLVLAGPDLLSGSGYGRAHALHELGSFDVALAVGFLCAAWRPIRAFGLLPVVAVLAAGLGLTATVDISEGHASTLTEGIHLLELAGFLLVWLLSREPLADPGQDFRTAPGAAD